MIGCTPVLETRLENKKLCLHRNCCSEMTKWVAKGMMGYKRNFIKGSSIKGTVASMGELGAL